MVAPKGRLNFLSVDKICPIGHEATSLYRLPVAVYCWESALARERDDLVSMHTQHRVPKDEQRSRGLLTHRGKGPLDIVSAFGLPGEQYHAQCWGCGLGQLPLEWVRGIGRIQEDGNMRCRRDDVLHEFKPFGDYASVKI